MMKARLMKIERLVCSMLLLSLFSFGMFFSGTPAQAGEDWDKLAQRIVNTSAGVKPGDVVVVAGGTHTVPLMEALSVEVQKAGGMVQMFLESDRVMRSLVTEVNEKYLDNEPVHFREWLREIDVWIGLPGLEDPMAAMADVPEDRFAKLAKANQVVNDSLNESGVRAVFVGYPTRQTAALHQMKYTQFEKMHWSAVNTDYASISEQGEKLKALLEGANTVTITSNYGTNLTFSVGDRPIFLNDGVVTEKEAREGMLLTRFASLPGGTLFFAPDETSANGKVVVPKDRCNFAPMTGISFEFKNGVIQNFKAETGGECFDETMAPYSGPKNVFGSFSIGLNPEMKVVEMGGDYRPDDAAGMVYIGCGENSLLGGANETDGEYGFPIINATVTVDGKVVVREGKLEI